MKTHLVIGLGEVGTAIQKLLRADGHDSQKEEISEGQYDVLHICFPYSEAFSAIVREYEEKFKSKMTIIHSTVPIGTTDTLRAVHSPVRGPHPHLEEAIGSFVKYFGGPQAEEASECFKALGIGVTCVPDARTTEALKLWDTAQYGSMILLMREIHAFCEEYEVDFGIVYSHANQTYNEGYASLGRKEVARPYLKYKEGPIGGHCVIPNAHLLDSPVAEFIINENGKL